MKIKELPSRLINAFKQDANYRLSGSYLTEMKVPPGLSTEQYLQSYGEVGWLYGAVSLIAQAVADSKWELYRTTGNGESEQVDKHPILDLLKFVNPFQTGYQFRLLAQTYISLVGECFIVQEFNKLGFPAQWWLAPPGYMHVVTSPENYISHYEYRRGGKALRLEIAEVIHVMDPNPANPYRGLGAAQSIAADLDSEKYASQYQRKLFFNDARPGLVVKIPGDAPPKEQRDQLYKEWNSQFRGWGKAYSTAFLWGGASIDNATMTNRDMDFTRLRGATKNTILAAYHIPLTMMGSAEVGSRARAEADEYIFSKYTTKPALTRFRESFNEQLIPLFGDDSLELRYVDSVPADRASIIDEVDKMVRAGVYTREFALTLLGHDISDLDGGTYLMPVPQLPYIPEPVKALPAKVSKGMSEDQKEAHWKEYIAKTDSQEKPFIRVFKQLLKDQEAEVLKNLENIGTAMFNPERSVTVFQEAFQPLITDVYEDHFVTSQRRVEPKAYRKVDNVLNVRALEWIKSRSLEMAKLINGTTVDQLRPVLAQAFEEGLGMDAIARRISEFYEDTFKGRALMVARTETIAASAEGTIEGYGSMGVQKTEFYAAMDERLCPICEGLNNTVFAIKDTSGMIPKHPRCRCAWIAIVE